MVSRGLLVLSSWSPGGSPRGLLVVVVVLVVVVGFSVVMVVVVLFHCSGIDGIVAFVLETCGV